MRKESCCFGACHAQVEELHPVTAINNDSPYLQTGAILIGALTLLVSVCGGIALLAAASDDPGHHTKTVAPHPLSIHTYKLLGIGMWISALSGLGIILSVGTRKPQLMVPYLVLQVSAEKGEQCSKAVTIFSVSLSSPPAYIYSSSPSGSFMESLRRSTTAILKLPCARCSSCSSASGSSWW